MKPRKPKVLLLTVMTWLPAAAPAGADVLSLLAVIAVAGYFFWRKRYRWGCTVILLSPFVIVSLLSFVWGVQDYFAGTAGLRYPIDSHRVRFASVDPQCRCAYIRYSGRPWCGWTEAVDRSYNVAVRVLVGARGPLKGSYLGPYPSAVVASQAMANAVEIPIDALAQNRLNIQERVVHLDQGIGHKLLRNTQWRPESKEMNQLLSKQYEPVRAVVFQSTCLIVRLSALRQVQNKTDTLLVLIDLTNGRPFACYPEGTGQSIHPFVDRWQK